MISDKFNYKIILSVFADAGSRFLAIFLLILRVVHAFLLGGLPSFLRTGCHRSMVSLLVLLQQLTIDIRLFLPHHCFFGRRLQFGDICDS